MKIEELKLNEKNPRTISEDNLEKLKKSIRKFEKMMEVRPIVIDETNTILGGNQRYKALVALGYTEVPEKWIKKTTDLTPKEKKEFIVKDNVSYGYWEWEKVESDFEKDDVVDWGLEMPFNFETTEETEEDYDAGTQDEEVMQGDVDLNDYATITLKRADEDYFMYWLGIERLKKYVNITEMKKLDMEEKLEESRKMLEEINDKIEKEIDMEGIYEATRIKTK